MAQWKFGGNRHTLCFRFSPKCLLLSLSHINERLKELILVIAVFDMNYKIKAKKTLFEL